LREIQFAHDLYAGLILEPSIPIGSGSMLAIRIHSYAEVLCWVLGHAHNRSFADHMEKVMKELKRRGIEMVEYPNAVSWEEGQRLMEEDSGSLKPVKEPPKEGE
jgi:hypothetical protein